MLRARPDLTNQLWRPVGSDSRYRDRVAPLIAVGEIDVGRGEALVGRRDKDRANNSSLVASIAHGHPPPLGTRPTISLSFGIVSQSEDRAVLLLKTRED